MGVSVEVEVSVGELVGVSDELSVVVVGVEVGVS